MFVLFSVPIESMSQSNEKTCTIDSVSGWGDPQEQLLSCSELSVSTLLWSRAVLSWSIIEYRIGREAAHMAGKQVGGMEPLPRKS